MDPISAYVKYLSRCSRCQIFIHLVVWSIFVTITSIRQNEDNLKMILLNICSLRKLVKLSLFHKGGKL